MAAIDITLDGLGEYLAERKVSPGTLSYMLDHQGRVIAASDLSKTYANVQGKLELLHITSLDNELPAFAFSARPRGSERPLHLHAMAARNMSRASRPCRPSSARSWQLFIITPLADFTGAFQANNIRLRHLRPDRAWRCRSSSSSS